MAVSLLTDWESQIYNTVTPTKNNEKKKSKYALWGFEINATIFFALILAILPLERLGILLFVLPPAMG